MTTIDPRRSSLETCRERELDRDPRVHRAQTMPMRPQPGVDGYDRVRAPRPQVIPPMRDLVLQRAESPADAHRCHEGYPVRDGAPFDASVARAHLHSVGNIYEALKGAREARAEWVKDNPNAHVPTDGQYTIDELLNHPTMSTSEVCVRITNIIIIENPEVVGAVANGTGAGPVPQETDATQQQQQQGPDMLKMGLGLFGGLATFLGPLLGNPLLAGIIGPLLLATPLAPIVPFLPIILPLAGAALTGLGGMASQAAGEPGQPAGQGGPSPDLLSGLLSTIPGLLGGAPAQPAPATAAA